MDTHGQPQMVDISGKPDSQRRAVAKGVIKMKPATLSLIKKKEIAKGNVLAVAKLAGIMAAKQTHHLIPLCHPVLISHANLEFNLDEHNGSIKITATVKCTGKTGVEVEALIATTVAAIAIYDMVKAVDRSTRIENIRLVSKSGGKSGIVNLE